MYDPAYCDEIVGFCGDGSSLTSYAAHVGVCRDTITEWMSVHPEFSLAAKRAKAACGAWWEKTARANAADGKGNATLCVFGLKNMASDDWRDTTRTELTGADGSAIQTTQEIRRIVVDPANPDS
jgi:hypothetical protein